MTTIIQAHDPSDFLALVPTLAGFQPSDSVVLVAFRGNRTCGALRVDLPPENAAAPVRKAFVSTTLGMICKIPGADALVPVIYTDDTFERYSGPPRRLLGPSDRVDRVLLRPVGTVPRRRFGRADLSGRRR